jgi:hypothetical protein
MAENETANNTTMSSMLVESAENATADPESPLSTHEEFNRIQVKPSILNLFINRFKEGIGQRAESEGRI